MAATRLPHATTEDVYRGWRITAGSIVIASAWGILHDENMYHDPFVIRPERHLEGRGMASEPHPGITGAFGFGRRCVANFYTKSCSYNFIPNVESVQDIF